MRLTLLGLSIFYMMHVAYAETTLLEIISLQA